MRAATLSHKWQISWHGTLVFQHGTVVLNRLFTWHSLHFHLIISCISWASSSTTASKCTILQTQLEPIIHYLYLVFVHMYAFIKIHLPLLLTLLICLLPLLCNNTPQSIAFQNRKSPAWTLQSSECTLSSPLTYQALWELCPPPANKATRRNTDRWVAQAKMKWWISSGCYCPAERGDDGGIRLCECECARVSPVRLWGMCRKERRGLVYHSVCTW